MSTQNIFLFLLIINIIFPVILCNDKVDYEENTISKMKTSLFNAKKEKIYYVGNLIKNKTIIAFADLDNDKYTDIIAYDKSFDENNKLKFNFYSYYYSKKENEFNSPKEIFSISNIPGEYETNDIYIRNLQVLSFGDDPIFLVSINIKDDTLFNCIVRKGYDSYTDLNISSNILILNKNEKKNYRLLYFKNNEIKICYLDSNLACKEEESPFTLKGHDGFELSLKGGLAYVDLDGNCVPDIILSFDNKEEDIRRIEVYNAYKNNTYGFNCEIILKEASKYGAFAVANINDKKSSSNLPLIGLLIPRINDSYIFFYENKSKDKKGKTREYKWSTYYCEDGIDTSEKEIFNSSDPKPIELKIEGKENVRIDASYPTAIRVGDFLGSSNPGIIVKQIYKDNKDGEDKYQISLYERNDNTFKYYTGIEISEISPDKNEEFTMGLFFDINEAGTLSFILPSNYNNNYFFFNYKRNIYFIKSKLMNDLDDFYDVNFGASYRYIVTDKKGDRHMDVGFQLAQTSDMNIPVPYTIMGLDDTNNYVEYFQTISGNILNNSIKFERSEEDNFKENSPIIPNTQMMISKYYNKKKKIEWNVDLIVQPMEQIWLFLLIVIIVLLIVLGFIIYLHLKEVKEEQKETNKFKSWFA